MIAFFRVADVAARYKRALYKFDPAAVAAKKLFADAVGSARVGRDEIRDDLFRFLSSKRPVNKIILHIYYDQIFHTALLL